MPQKINYSTEPDDKQKFTQEFDADYTRFAAMYDSVVKILPIWKNWLKHTLPHIQGPRVLEVSFGTGYLLTQYASRFKTYGIDYNQALIRVAQNKLKRLEIPAALQQADVGHLPYLSESIDTVVNTMAFSGYPNGQRAMAELHRVLKPGGRLVMVDIEYPRNRNWLGTTLTRVWASSGDIIRDMPSLLESNNFKFECEEIGGFGSVHLFVATKM